jgi:hypothetical protein
MDTRKDDFRAAAKICVVRHGIDEVESMNRGNGLATVRAEIVRACRDAGRDPATVTLVAISKTFGAEAIEPIIAAGQRVFGENRVQEAKAASSCISSVRCNRTKRERRWRCSTPSIRSIERALPMRSPRK